MNEFDVKASEWDSNPMHWERSMAIAQELIHKLPIAPAMNALEFGAGTGILSFMLKNYFKQITLMDNSIEMVKIMNDKIAKSNVSNLKTLYFDLERNDYLDGKFDLIFTQMVLHHVYDIDSILERFYKMLSPLGYLAIADLYREDGSFHGDGFTGHNGFDVETLSSILGKHYFRNISHKQCFVIKREMPIGETKQFPVFLLVANRS